MLLLARYEVLWISIFCGWDFITSLCVVALSHLQKFGCFCFSFVETTIFQVMFIVRNYRMLKQRMCIMYILFLVRNEKNVYIISGKKIRNKGYIL